MKSVFKSEVRKNGVGITLTEEFMRNFVSAHSISAKTAVATAIELLRAAHQAKDWHPDDDRILKLCVMDLGDVLEPNRKR